MLKQSGSAWQPLAPFLGLDFDFRDCLHTGVAKFFVRERLIVKVQDMIEQAAKLSGTCNFLEQGMYGRVGAGGLRAIRERADEGGRDITPPIMACFDLIRAVLAVRPERKFDVLPRECRGFLLRVTQQRMFPAVGLAGSTLSGWMPARSGRASWPRLAQKSTLALCPLIIK